MWLVDRVIDPKEIDAELDARLRGERRPPGALPLLHRAAEAARRRAGRGRALDEALEFLRECLAEAIAGQVRIELSESSGSSSKGARARPRALRAPGARARLAARPAPLRGRVRDRAGAPVELQRGLELGGFTVSGKIDRIDLDPFSARGIVQDYKSGPRTRRAQIESEGKLQIPLYVLALRDLVGIEPLGGLYRALAGSREARGLVRADAAAEEVPG